MQAGKDRVARGTRWLAAFIESLRRLGGQADLDGLARSAEKRLARVIAGPWLLATGEDYLYAETTGGRRNSATRLMHQAIGRIMAAANRDARVFIPFFEVTQLLRPVSALFQPGVLARVWFPVRRK